MSEKILIEYGTNVDKLQGEFKEIQSEMKATEKVGIDSAKHVGDAFVKTEEKTKSLKAQLKDLKAQLANTTDPKEFNRLAEAAGKVQDKINDASDATKAFAKESKAGTAKTLFSQIAGDISQLDFKGAADKARQFASVMSSITLAETVAGVKDLGIALFNMGKALLLNPLFLLAATIIAVGKATYDATVFMIDYGKQSQVVTDVLNEQSKSMKNFTDRILESQIALKETLGIYSKFQAEQARTTLKNNNTLIGLEKEKNAKIKELAEQLGLDLVKGQAKIKAPSVFGALNPFDSQADDLLNLKKFNEERLIIEKSYDSKIKLEKILQSKESRDAQIKDNIERAKIANDFIEKNRQKQIADNEKQIQLDKEIAAKKLEIEKRLRDLRTAIIEDERTKEKVALSNKLDDDILLYKGNDELIEQLRENFRIELLAIDKKYDDKEKTENEALYQDAIKAAEAATDEAAAIDSKAYKEKKDKREKDAKDAVDKEREKQAAIKQLQQDGFQFSSSLLDSIGSIENNIANQRIEEVQKNSDKEKQILESQLNSGLITKIQYESKVKQLEDAKRAEEAEIRKEQFEREKQIALIKIAIATAQGIAQALEGDPYSVAYRVAFAALTGAAQAAIVESQPTPKFAKGGKVEGKLHSQGGTLIEAEKGEWIIKRNESIKNNDLLNAINKGKGQKYIYEMYVAPALKEQKKKHTQNKDNSFASNIANSMLLNSGNFKDGNILESLKMSRKLDKDNMERLINTIKNNKTNIRNIV